MGCTPLRKTFNVNLSKTESVMEKPIPTSMSVATRKVRLFKYQPKLRPVVEVKSFMEYSSSNELLI